VGRALNDAVLLAPGVAGTAERQHHDGRGRSPSKPVSVNGVVVERNLRGQALNLFIEDAVQETKVSTGASRRVRPLRRRRRQHDYQIGRQRFSGSFRTTFNDDACAR